MTASEVRPAEKAAPSPLVSPHPERAVGVASPGPRAPRGGIRSLRTFESFHDPTFRWFFLAMLGQMAAMNSQMLVRGWLTYDLTGSYADLGLVAVASATPMLFLSMIGGVFADRFPKRQVLQLGQTASLLLAATMAVLLFADVLEFWHLITASVVQGTIMALMMPSRQSMIPDLVPPEQFTNAIALNAAGMNSMRLLAPGLGGIVIGLAGASWVYLAMTALYGFAILGLTKVPAVAPRRRDAADSRGGVSDLLDGFRYIRRTPTIFALLIASFITSLLAMPYLHILAGYVDDVFGAGPEQLGILISLIGVGALVGALFLASIRDGRRGLILLLSVTLMGVGLIGLAVVDSFYMAMPVMLVLGLGSAGRQALSNVLIQSNVEDAYRGRVMSVYMTQFSVMSFGTFGIGLVSEVVGVQVVIGMLGITLIAVMLGIMAFVPLLRRMR